MRKRRGDFELGILWSGLGMELGFGFVLIVGGVEGFQGEFV